MVLKSQFTVPQLLDGLLPQSLVAGVTQQLAKQVVSGLSQDSRDVQPGYLFFARTGVQHRGLEFVAAAAANGALAALVSADELAHAQQTAGGEDAFSAPIPVIGVADIDALMGRVAARFYGEPSQQLKMIGVTGTNGKTSCSHYIAQALACAGEVSALIGTVGNGLLGQLEPATHTTPDAIRLQALLADLLAKGATAVVMEVSSHALDQQRVAGVEFDVAAFTNLSRDHLDYHGDMATYGAAKAQLFTALEVPRQVINLDDAFGEQLLQTQPSPDGTNVKPVRLSFGEDPRADVAARQVTLSTAGICAQVDTPWGTLQLNTGLIGRFNLSNLLLTIGVVGQLGLSIRQIEEAVNAISAVPGRMQIVMHSQPLVVVDYAHTPDALEKALLALSSHCNGRLWCVFGCGGDRDTGKRPQMGAIAAQLADCVVVTSDNPRSEDPEQIIAMVLDGIETEVEVLSISNRASAIEHTIAALADSDIALIAGKGHETYQEVKGVRMPFDDVEIARQALDKRAVR